MKRLFNNKGETYIDVAITVMIVAFVLVFSPIEVAPIKVEFYNVRPSDIVLTEAEESLCIYENWHNPEDDGYERNLEGWLHNRQSSSGNKLPSRSIKGATYQTSTKVQSSQE